LITSNKKKKYIPYGRQWIDEDDIAAVCQVLRSDWLTTGPLVTEFENILAQRVDAASAVAVSNGTAALHAAMFALELEPGDEVIVPPMTFAATSNCVVFQGGIPVFSDVDGETLLLDPAQIEAIITPKTRAIIAVDYAGQPCDYDALKVIADRHGLRLVADACHSLGAAYKGRSVGSLADLNTFSFHPVKHITTGEGGCVTTNDENLARRLKLFRNHGISTDHQQREQQGSWFYEMVALGYNYRLTDFQCALGLSQLKKLPGWITRRQEIAQAYDTAFAGMDTLAPLRLRPEVSHAYHLYTVQLDLSSLRADRATIFSALREEGIGVNVHYIPVHLHPFYRERFGTGRGLCPVAEAAYERLLTLPMFPKMTDADVEYVISAVKRVLQSYQA
jgi:perosamine synthetase